MPGSVQQIVHAHTHRTPFRCKQKAHRSGGRALSGHDLVCALILGLVEGLTEFLPISSTGHLILAGDLLGFNDERAKVFDVVIQTGAMFAIVWEYRMRFVKVVSGIFSDP